MPPIKGPSMKQQTLGFKKIKKPHFGPKSGKFRHAAAVAAVKLKSGAKTENADYSTPKKPRGRVAQNAKIASGDMHVKLRIPVAICKMLPSVKVVMKKGNKADVPLDQRGRCLVHF